MTISSRKIFQFMFSLLLFVLTLGFLIWKPNYRNGIIAVPVFGSLSIAALSTLFLSTNIFINFSPLRWVALRMFVLAIGTVYAVFALSIRSSRETVSFILLKNGFDSTSMAIRLWREDAEEFYKFVESAKSVSNPSTLDCKKVNYSMRLNRTILLQPIHLQPTCSKDSLEFPFIAEGGTIGGVNSWSFVFLLNPNESFQCGEGIDCTEIVPHWYLRSFVTQ
jgi:hypothetical protein